MISVPKLMTLLILASSLVACNASKTPETTPSNGNGSDGNGGSTIDPTALRAAATDAELEAQIKAALLNSYGSTETIYADYLTSAINSSEVALATAPSAEAADVSGTNTQESAVDEADRLKTDGEFLYASSMDTPTINIFKAETGAAPLVQSISLETMQSKPLSGFYLRDAQQQLLAIAGDGQQLHSAWDMWFSPYHWESRQTELFYLDISNPESPAQQAKLSIDGQLVSSRRIGSYLYLATRHTPTPKGIVTYPTSQTDAALNRSLINNAALSDLLPTYRVNGGEKLSLFDSGDCFMTGYSQTNSRQSSIISVVAINLDAASPQPEAKCFVGDAETLYVSEKALYLATTGYHYSTDNGIATYRGTPTTEIHKFALSGTDAAYKGSSSVAGHLGWQQDLKPFRMSEHNDVLRIITYTGAQASSIESPAHLYTLAEDASNNRLKVLGKLPNTDHPDPLGKPGEQIYATRFIGDKGYLVTFRTTDPLYILDLADPANPSMISELEIDGYSDYLHPVGENYLLGIGKDAKADTINNGRGDGRGAWYQGVKLSLIDISNLNNPVEKQTIIIGGRGTETAVSRTHHALTTLRSGNTLRMALPISLHDTPPAESYYAIGDPRYHFDWTQDALYRLNINTTTGSMAMQQAITAETNQVGINYNTRWELDRSVMIGDEVYYLHQDAVRTLADIE